MKIVSGYFDRIDSKTQRLMEAVGSPLVKVSALLELPPA
jgi:hypothetical protein